MGTANLVHAEDSRVLWYRTGTPAGVTLLSEELEPEVLGRGLASSPTLRVSRNGKTTPQSVGED